MVLFWQNNGEMVTEEDTGQEINIKSKVQVMAIG